MHVTVWLLTLHVHPVPLAAVGVSPVGSVSVTVTVVPFVAGPPLLVTVSVNVPVLPRVNVALLAVFVIVNDGSSEAGLSPPPPLGATVLTVTDPDADELSPPPTTLAVFVSDAPASLATDAVTLTPA